MVRMNIFLAFDCICDCINTKISFLAEKFSLNSLTLSSLSTTKMFQMFFPYVIIGIVLLDWNTEAFKE